MSFQKKCFLSFFFLFCIFIYGKKVSGQCSVTTTIWLTDLTPTSVILHYNSGQGTFYFEYGLAGFTPGTDSLPGIGGIVGATPGTFARDTVMGLIPSTLYDCYVRKLCTNGTWTTNSPVKTFRTFEDCSIATVISCGGNNTVSLQSGIGSWSIICNSNNYQGRDKIYRITPNSYGNLMLITHTDTSNTNFINFSYKEASGSCNNVGWNCIGYSSNYSTQQYSFGPVSAGTTYLIKATAYNQNSVSDVVTFRVECPWSPQPVIDSINNVGIVTADVNTTSSFGYIEYGPSGFMPGISNIPGAGGTIGYSTYLDNLQGSTAYDVYIRNFGQQNSFKKTFYTLSCLTPTIINHVDVLTGVYSWSPFYNYYNLCASWSLPGRELRASFTSPKTNYYEVELPYYSTPYNFAFKEFDNTCSPNSYNCQTPYLTEHIPNSNQYINYYMIGPLNSGIAYDLMFDHYDTLLSGLSISINCPRPKNITISNIQPNSIDFNWTCNCPDTTFLEYGFKGFTPGIDGSAGSGGTLITGVSSPYTLSGLQADTTYDIYFRTSCGGQYSKNTKLTQRTSFDCSNAQVVTCGDYLTYHYNTMNGTNNYGAWLDTICGNSYANGPETIFKFTPTTSGYHSIYTYIFSASNYSYSYPVNFYYKADSLNCNEVGWNCIGSVISSPVNFLEDTFQFGPLTAGVTYLILVDGYSHYFHRYDMYFRLDCSYYCTPPFIYPYGGSQLLSPSSVVINTVHFFQDVYLEYGQSGFLPGTDSLPGVGGTVIHPVTFPDTITNLSQGVSYDFYLRSFCDTLSGFSANSIKKTFYTCSLPPGIIGPPPFCSGDSVILKRTGGILAAGGVYAWYKDSCGGTFLDYGDSIKILPAGSKYYLRAEAPCGNSTCAQIQPMPSTPNPYLSGDTLICIGDSSVLNSQSGYVSYLWSTGDTTKSIVAYSAGVYTLTVTNNLGCVGSKSITVTVDPGIIPIITGDSSICIGDSVTLDAGSGYNCYLWSTGDSTQTIILNTAGNYSITVCDSNGCKGSATVTTTIDSLPIVSISVTGNTNICLGDTVILNTPLNNGWTYQWLKNNNLISGAINSLYGAYETGNYRVQGFDLNGCSNLSSSKRITIVCYPMPPDIDKYSSEPLEVSGGTYFTIFSKPITNGHLLFIYRSEKKERSVLELFDVSGRSVFSAAVIPQRDKQTIVLPRLSNGLYNCIFTSGNKKITKKVAIISP